MSLFSTLLNDPHEKSHMRNMSESFEFVVSPKGIVIFDFDRDGDLDFITGENAMRGHKPKIKFFRNYIQETKPKSFISLIVQGDGEGVPESPVGTKVTLHSDGNIQMRELVFGGGQDASSPLEAHFGTGTEINSNKEFDVSIRWSNGKEEKFTIKNNSYYHIKYDIQGSSISAINF